MSSVIWVGHHLSGSRTGANSMVRAASGGNPPAEVLIKREEVPQGLLQ
jgi:hypothetical protein